MSIQTIKPVDQFAAAQTLVIKQNFITSDYCCCCWSINGKYYEIRTSEDEKDEPLLFRADEDLSKPSISIKDSAGLMFVRLVGGEGHCQCGGIPEWHRKIDVHCTPGETVGSIHYNNPSFMLMKDAEGEPLFRLTRQSPPIYSNPLKRTWLENFENWNQDPKFQVFSTNPEFPEALSTISRKGRSYASYGQGWSIDLNFEDSLDLEAKALILGAAFPIGIEYFEGSVFDNDQYGVPITVSRHNSSAHSTHRPSKSSVYELK